MILLRVLLSFLCVLVGATAWTDARADEKHEAPEYWLSRGYKRVVAARSRAPEATPPWAAHSLNWPVQFVDAGHSIGNSMAEFQSYGDGPYYHGGCDLRVSRAAEVRAPVEGRVEAGHYGYSNLPNGSSSKYWYAWPQDGDSLYFEVAIITDEGFRFEFHHMDASRLPAPILQILKEGRGGKVPAGTLLGYTMPWPGGAYHHTHYNILSPSGVQLNPEFYSPLIADSERPTVNALLASFSGGETAEFGTGRFDKRPEFFAAAVVDRVDGGVYDHPPVFAGIQFEDGHTFAWDFRERLRAADGSFPPIWDFFIDSIRSPDGIRYRTDGGYGIGTSVIRIPVPAGAQGGFKIRIEDQAGNASEFAGTLGPAF